MISKDIFKKFDVRGRYPEEINEDIFFHIGRAFVKIMKADTVVIGYDGRKSSKSLFDNLVKGINYAGAKVINIGICSTPVLYFSVCHLQEKAGLMITASHLGKEFNGLKMIGKNAITLKEEEMREIKKQFEKNIKSFKAKKISLQIENYSAKEAYLDDLKRFSKRLRHKTKIVVDCGGGANALYAENIFNNLENIEPVYLFCEIDANFSGRGSNPKIGENRELIVQKIKKEKADLGIMYDGDGDRVYFLNRNGEVIDPNFVSALIVEYLAVNTPNKKFVADIRSSKVIADMVKKAGGKLFISPAWHVEIKKMSKKNNAIFGSETSGHYIFGDFYNIDDGFLASLIFLQAIDVVGVKKFEKKLSKLKNSYHILEETNFEISLKDEKEILNRIEKKYKKEAKIIVKIDGLTIEFAHWRFNLRKSLSEPLLRLNMEADTSELLQEKLKEISKEIK